MTIPSPVPLKIDVERWIEPEDLLEISFFLPVIDFLCFSLVNGNVPPEKKPGCGRQHVTSMGTEWLILPFFWDVTKVVL